MDNMEIRECPEMETKRRNKKAFTVFKALFFIICFSGFTYQVTDYFIYYFSYPTLLNMKIEKDSVIIPPAISFCEVSVTSRIKYCNSNPNDCEYITQDNNTCKENPKYCGDDTTIQVPKREIMLTKRSEIFRRMMSYGRDWTEYVKIHNRSYEQKIGEPFYLITEYPIPEMLKCFTINSRLDSDKDPVTVNIHDSDTESMGYPERPYLFWLEFQIQVNDVFSPGTVPAMHLQIHSPFVTPNPVEQGFRMKPDMLYFVDVHLGCKSLCSAKFDIEYYGCVRHSHKFPTPYKCSELYIEAIRGEEDFKRLQRAYEQCKSQCKIECRELKYHNSVRDVSLSRMLRRWKKSLHVQVFLADPEIFILEYKPQYQKVEFFSYLGGFLGCWLGISLFAISDIAKSAYIFIKSRYHQLKY